MAQSKSFTLGGRSLNWSYEKVVKSLRGVQPETIQKYYVEVGNTKYPIKQAFAVATGFSLAAFTSQHAYRMLQSVGFEIKEKRLTLIQTKSSAKPYLPHLFLLRRNSCCGMRNVADKQQKTDEPLDSSVFPCLSVALLCSSPSQS